MKFNYSFFALFVHVHGDNKTKIAFGAQKFPGNRVSNELIHVFVATLSNDVFTMSLNNIFNPRPSISKTPCSNHIQLIFMQVPCIVGSHDLAWTATNKSTSHCASYQLQFCSSVKLSRQMCMEGMPVVMGNCEQLKVHVHMAAK